MDTGTAERATPDAERLAGRTWPGAVPVRSHPVAEPRAPAMPAPPAVGADPLARGLAALAPFGRDTRRRERFLAAREQGCCHQCHAPLQNLLNDCPCPHWFITSASTIERIAPVLRMYSVADVLHFILLHLAADNGGRALPRTQLGVSTHDDGPELAVRIGRKLWSFRATHNEGEPARFSVGLFNPRTGKRCAIELPATPTDLDVMRAVTQAVGAS